MPPLRIALAQVDVAVGDLDGNADIVSAWVAKAREQEADLVAFPEMALTGYPPEDLVLRRSFAGAAKDKLRELAARLADEGAGDIAVVVGYLDRADEPTPRLGRPAGEPQNAAAMLFGGEVVAEYAKHHLPNYGVFDEFRYFVPGDRFPVLRLHGIDVGLTVCEDLWQDGGPIHVAHEAGVGLVVCINGSPYERGKTHTRDELSARRAKEAGAPLAYVNLVGGQDELVFDGGSLVVDADGNLVARAGQFDEELLVVDLDLPAGPGDEPPASVNADDGTTMSVRRTSLAARARPDRALVAPPIAERMDDCAELYAACVLGTRDYVRKNGFRSVVLGLSGGIDSALVATIAVDALGADVVHTVALPSAYSSEHSVSDADDLAHRQGTQHTNLPIASVVDAYQELLQVSGVAEENLQARVRGTALMALSNADGHLVLTTGNKSELATGFSTLYGDSAGGFAPIKDVPKTAVWELSRWRNAEAARRGETEPIPVAIIEKAPSAELAPGQLDSDRLPDYPELDAVLDGYVEKDMGYEELRRAGHSAETIEWVIRLVDAAEYKRRQYPPGPKVTSKAFGRDRRLPITSRWREKAAQAEPDPDVESPERASSSSAAN
jgi:NAD+ synthase (glutamine-hydrolysing)